MTTQTEALRLALEAYLCREMPAGTIIGDPKWWVPKIANAIKEALAKPDQYAKGYADAMNWKTANHLEHLPVAQPEQEPVALKLGECWPENVMQMWDYYRKEIANGNTGSEPRDWFESLSEMRLVDTTPPQRTWVGLTEEDIDDAEIHLTSCRNSHESWIEGIQEFAQAIEAKLKEKNT